jgi:hypothetical protein
MDCKRAIHAAILLLLFASHLMLKAQDPPKLPPRTPADAGRITSNIVALTRTWLDGQLASGNLSAEFRELSRSHQQGKLKVVYHVHVKGASPDKIYSLLSWPIEAKEPVEMVKGASVTAEGLLVCAGRAPDQCGSAGHKDDPILFTLTPRKGEVTRLALVSADKSAKITFGIVPDPITATARGCTVDVVRLAPKFEVAMVRGHGFKPGESITFSAKAFTESQGGPVKADEKGEFVAGVTPYVKGKLSGTTVVKLTTPHCAPEVSFVWGR